MSYPVINTDDCVACGACADACPMGVIEVNDYAEAINKDDCVGCGACLDACPAGAITEIAED
ncbi:MAG: 4Fe-4S binding protein [Olegusella sp.]|nr:4Fe-4S binding protein [Olegusella sp.]